jgi:hypothetical protein
MVVKVHIFDRDGNNLDLVLLLGWEEEYEVPWFDDNMLNGQSDPNKIRILKEYIRYLGTLFDNLPSGQAYDSLTLYQNSWTRVLSHMEYQVCYITCV